MGGTWRRLRLVVFGGLSLVCASQAMAATDCKFTKTGSVWKLKADCTTDAPISVPDGFTLDGSGRTMTAVDPPGGSFLGGVIVNEGPVLTVINLQIVGALVNPACQGGAGRFRGILTSNTTQVRILNNTIKEIHRGPPSNCDEGNAIVVNPPSTGRADIVGNRVVNFQRLGIIVAGGATGTIWGNDVRTSLPVPLFGQFAVELTLGSSGVMAFNTVVTASQGHPNVAGLFAFDTQNVQIFANQVANTGVGIAVQGSCEAPPGPPTTSGNQIRLNRIRGADVDGILILARSNPDSVCTPHADGNLVELNDIEAESGLTGIHIVLFPNGFAFPLTADSNVIRFNEIEGYAAPITDGGTNTVIKNNKIEP
jgi:hypothetical protein